MLELQNAMLRLKDDEISEQFEQLTASWTYDKGKKSISAMKKVVATYLILNRWATERGYLGLSIKCPTGVSAHMDMTPCLVGSLLSRKLHYVCENDIPGLLGQVILGLLSDEMSTYWEFYQALDDGVLMGCCGFCPESFLAESMRVKTYDEFFTGTGCCSRVRTGPYTLVRLGTNRDKQQVYTCAEGEAFAPPQWYEDALGMPQHPSVRFVPNAVSMRDFIGNALAQHVAVVPGHWGEAVAEFATMKNIALQQ